ncbi:hypothetical protein [Bernardetia sp.]|uniref:hypothetical protein n=1 Tax=Bernardetia sp. TaxID=1937974 RepID=UPI0025C35836|nr:hypothetical protein [Bernardetia sp.]
MNSYILEAKEHKTLLAQNRIDPITGDLIKEGDEVVFCAGCKSIFLKDTWEYLGQKHCNQTATLNCIPVSSAKLKLGNDILYIHPIKNISTIELEIVSLMEYWIYSEKDTGKYHDYFFGDKADKFKIFVYVFFFILSQVIYYNTQNGFLFLISIACTFASYPFLKFLIYKKYRKTLKDKYRNITEQSFLVKNNGISVCSEYGITEVFLPSKKLKAVTLSNLGFFSKSEIIFEYDEERKLTIPIKKIIDEGNFFPFLKALARFSQGLDFPITLFIDDKEKIEQANRLITETKAKFTIESREDVLKMKYGSLYKYADKIEKLLS